MGTKFKFWYQDAHLGLALFKEGRPGTGENWAEKISSEFAGLIGLPHARYELATWRGRRGIVAPTLVLDGTRLVHGNELLSSFVRDYAKGEAKAVQRQAHTLRRVVSYLRASSEGLGVPPGFDCTASVTTALDVFVGYLMFDAWIANQDRHDENWAVLRTGEGNSFLAPSYDHGSSLGRNESDERRALMLTTKDKGQRIEAYVARAKSSLFAAGTPSTPLSTLDAYVTIANVASAAAVEWKSRLEQVTMEQTEHVINEVPAEWMTAVARRFTLELLSLNRQRILDLKVSK